MAIAVTGSIASDHLMHFPGRFADQLVADQLENISLSFLVDELDIRRGGIAANVCFGMGQLGVRSVLVGAAGSDFDDYRTWLEKCGVDCDSVLISASAHTARFVCTTDDDMCQIGSFYTGAMAEARTIALAPVAERVGGLDLVLVSANDPDAMVRHSAECRERGYRFAADPSQQLARMSSAEIHALIDGAAYLFTNDYELGLLQQKTELSGADLLDVVDVVVTTLGSRGVRLSGRGLEPIHVPVAKELARHDPTGVGDGFRAGFFAAASWGISLERCAQVGSLVAAYVIETVGTQEYAIEPDVFLRRLAESYGDEAAADVAPHLR